MTSPVAILLGEASPIIRATASRLARRGLSIVFCTPDGQISGSMRPDLEPVGSNNLLRPTGSAGESDWHRIAESVVDQFGELTILVNTLGTLCSEDHITGSTLAAVAVLETYMRSTRAIAPHIARNGAGRIVHLLSSIARYRSAYFTSLEGSHADEALVGGAIFAANRQLALELGPFGIRVNAVVAGLIEGDMGCSGWQRMSERDRHLVLQEISLGRLGRPDEVASAIEFLASDASHYLTGTAIDVNGGWWVS
jgi:3-oxoacyl-[acyl-carrier protein] reductase